MTNEPSPVTVEFTRDFHNDLGRLFKKYRHVRADVDDFIRRLEAGETPGDQIRGMGYTVYKARVKSRDLRRGKSGGYRVCYYIRTAERIVLLTIYAKTEREDISPAELRDIVNSLPGN